VSLQKNAEGLHYIVLEGSLVLSGHRIGVQVGAHEVIQLDDLLRALAGKEVVVRVEEKK
jgi:hypothetical protein